MATIAPMLPTEHTARLREALAEAGYTVEGVRAVLGARAGAALDRNETTPGMAATTGGSSLETLIRLWPLQAPVARAAAQTALPCLDALVASGILTDDGSTVQARVDVRPYADDAGDWWLLADLTPGLDGTNPAVPDAHVLGVNAASSTLAQLTVRRPVNRALDLGTGGGVQALHLARHAGSIVGTDINPRALAMAGVTAALNGLELDLRQGDLFHPVADERFDLIVTNPPFVVSPGGHHVYRDSGLAGDSLSRQVMLDGARHLAPGGRLQMLANWMHLRGSDWIERVGEWAEATGCDAWVVQREVQDPAEYVELWLRDSGERGASHYRKSYADWLDWFDANDVEGVGFGWVTLVRSERDPPVVELESWPHAVAQPLGPTIAERFDRLAALPDSDDELLGLTLSRDAGISQEQIGQPGEEDPEHLLLRQRHGLMRARAVGTEEAGLVGACEGSVPLAPLMDAVAAVCEVDPTDLRRRLLPRVRELVTDGYLHIAER